MVDEADRLEGVAADLEHLEENLVEAQHELHELEELGDKTAHPLELFFDLVFVFAITQVVSLILHDLTLSGVLKGALVLALLWWGWGVWTWTTNLVDLEPRLVRVSVLVSMLGVFAMAFAVPRAFDTDGMWIAVGYTWVRVVAAVVLILHARNDPAERRAVRAYLPLSGVSPVLVLIGAAVGGDGQIWLWVVALGIELLAALAAGRADWQLKSGHFAERHGLIMIIALGEGIIAVGVALGELSMDIDLVILLAVGLVGVCAMWWAYFDRLQGGMEAALEAADEHHTGTLARDVYSILHYPMIVGIVFYAVALEEAFHHPDEPVKGVVATLFVTALALYFLAQAIAIWRCWRTYLYERVVGVIVIGALVAAWSAPAKDLVLVSTLVLMATLTAEYVRFRSRLLGLEPTPSTATTTSPALD